MGHGMKSGELKVKPARVCGKACREGRPGRVWRKEALGDGENWGWGDRET